MKHSLIQAMVCLAAVIPALGVYSVAASPGSRPMALAASSRQAPFPARKLKNARSLFDPSGDYHPAETQLAGPFKFIQFALEVRRREGKKVVLGEVKEVGRWFRFTSVSISGNVLRFRTRSIGGVSYRFAGHFLAQGNFREPGEYSAVLLKGTLEKFVNQRKMAGLKGPWVYYPGC